MNEPKPPSAQHPVPEPFKPPPGNPRFPLFDGLRAIAAVGVLLGHSAGVTLSRDSALGQAFGDMVIGVTVFFVVSGFLLYRPFVSGDLTGRGGPPTLTFYWRRLLRIFPGYWFALLAFALLPGMISVIEQDWWWRYFLLIQNYSSPELVFQPGIGPAWSLSVEIAFYAALPLFALAMRRVGGVDPNRRLIADLCVLAAITLTAGVVRAILVGEIRSSGGWTNLSIWSATLTLPLFLGWFAIGMAFASISAWSWRTGRVPRALRGASLRPGIVWAGALAFYLLLAAATPPLAKGEATAHHLLAALVAAALVFPAAFPHPEREGVPARILSAPLVAWIGVISYGIYLWADPIKVSLLHYGLDDLPLAFPIVAAAVLVFAVGAGAFSYYVIERPFLRLKNRRAKAESIRPAGAEPVAEQTG